MVYQVEENLLSECLDPMTPMYEEDLPPPKSDLSATPLAGKYIRYGYETFWEVNKDKGAHGTPEFMVHDVLFHENGDSEWFSLDRFDGENSRQPCGAVEIAPNIYMVSWREPARIEYVTMAINLNEWKVNTTFVFNGGKGLALLEAKILSFGDIPEPPITLPK